MTNETLTGLLESVNRGTVKDFQHGKVVVPSAFVKEPISGAVRLGVLGVLGDEHAYKHHGGPDLAVCVYSKEYYPWWQEKIPAALPPAAAFGENFTVSGLLDDAVCLGDQFEVGGAVIKVTQPRLPCFKIARRYGVPLAAVWMQRESITGYLCSVAQEGYVQAGQVINLIEREATPTTVRDANRILYLDKDDKQGAKRLLEFQGLPADIRKKLLRRLEKD